MSSVFDQGPPQPCPQPFNMAQHVMAAGLLHPDKIALSVLQGDGNDEWTYQRLTAAVLGTATGLLQLGLTPGDTLLMRLGNTVDFPIAYLAAIAVGVIPVPTSSQLTRPEVTKICAELNPAAILYDPQIACPDHPNRISLAQAHAMHDLPPALFQMGDPNRLAYVIYTSGTSGTPRAVAHAHRAIWARQMMFDGWSGLRADDRLLHAGAFNWTYTLGTGLMDPWTIGATALIPAPGTDIGAMGHLLARNRATIFAAAPGVYRKLLGNSPDLHLPYLRHGLAAGEKLSETLREAWHTATGTRIFEAYGMSECSTFISSSPNSPPIAGHIGTPQPGRRIAILDDQGPVPVGHQGTIAVHRDDPGLMLGYLNAPGEMAAKMQGDWFLTGDLAAMEPDGQITYLGRRDDMMNAGGFRVSPLEVEAALASHPGIDAVGVTDIEIKPDTFIIAAFYTGPNALEETALAAYVKTKLARYKHPRAYYHLAALPTGANGKLLRRALHAAQKDQT